MVRSIRFSEADLPVEAFEHVPSLVPAPALIIAPGQGYHMELPLIRQLAEASMAQGFAVFRFDFPYYTAGGAPSGDLQKEAEAMALVLEKVRENPKVDPRRIYLAGKSMGSKVAYSLFRRTPDLAGLLLLTPVCREASDTASWYPKLAEESRPVLFVSGRKDPLCSQPVLKEYIAAAGSNVNLVSVPGDHGFNLGDYKDPEFAEPNQTNLSSIIEKVLNWTITQIKGNVPS